MSEVVDISPGNLDSSLWIFLPAIFIPACASSSAAFRVMMMLFSCLVMSNSLRPHGLQASLSFTISQNLLKLMSIKSVMPSNHLVFCRHLLFSIFPSIRVFSKESVLCIRWPKYKSFIFSISLSNEYSWLVSFRIDWFDDLAVQGTFKNLLQHRSSKALVLQCSTCFVVQFSHPYMITRKTIALTICTFVVKMMSLVFAA